MSAAGPEQRLSSVASGNAATAVAARLSAILVGLILTPYVLGKLEARMYGLVVAVGSVYEYLSLLRGGMGGALRRYVTLHHHAGQKKLAAEYYSVGFWWAGILRFVVLIGGLALSWPITKFFRIEEALRPEAALGVALVFLAGVVTDQAVLFTIPIYATGRTASISIVQTVYGWLRIVVVFATLTWLGATLPVYGGALVIMELLTVVAFMVIAQRAGTVGAAVPRPQIGSPAVRRELFRYGGLALLSQAAALLYLSTDNLLIGRIYGPEAVTHYSLGTRWTPLIMGFLLATMSGLTPIFTSLEARGEQERSRDALLRVLDVTAALAFPLCLAPCVVGDLFLEHWVGPQYRDSALYMIAMLGPAAIDGALTPVWMALNARGRIGWVATSDVLVALGNVAISLIMALPLGLGLLGFALGNTIALLVKNALLIFIVRRRDPTMPSLGSVLRPLPLGLVGALPGLVVLWLLRPVLGGSLGGVVVAGLLGGGIGVSGALFVTCGPRGIAELWRLLPFNRTRRRPVEVSAAPHSRQTEERDMISVIIPVYNGRDVIERAILSLEAQTVPPGEIIVVDDHSTDGTKEMLVEWGRAGRIRLLHRERGGPARARNDGLAEARGRWVAFLDADDEFTPRALEACRDAVERDREADWLMTDVIRVRPDREESRACAPPRDPGADWVAAILDRNFVERGFFFRRRTLLEFGGFHAEVTYFEDWDLFIRLIRAGKRPRHVPEALYRYIETEGSITRDPDFMVRVLRRVLERHHEPLARSGSSVYRRIYAHRLWGMGQDYYYKLHRPGKAMVCLIESLRYDFNWKRIFHLFRVRHTDRDRKAGSPSTAPSAARSSAAEASPRAPREILFVETSPYPSYGGSKRVLVNLVHALDRSRWSPRAVFHSDGPWVGDLTEHDIPVTVVRPEFAGGHQPTPLRSEEVGWKAVGVRRTEVGDYRLTAWRRLWRESRLLLRYAWLDRRAGRRLDPLVPKGVALIHYNGPMHAEYAWYHLARRRGIPFVTHEHGRWRTPPQAWRWVARGAAAVLCLTEDRLGQVRAFAGPQVKAAWLPNGVPQDAFHPRRSRAEVRRELGIAADTLVVLTAGHLQRWKGQDLAVEAARRLREPGRNVVWLLAGREIESDFVAELRERIEAQGLRDHVRFLGERNDLPDLFAAADVAVHTSVHPEPFGMVIVEAMAAGIPVVGPAEGAVPQLVRDGLDGRIYRPRDAASLAEAILPLLTDDELRARLGASARERARVEFSLTGQVRRASEIYAGILGESA